MQAQQGNIGGPFQDPSNQNQQYYNGQQQQPQYPDQMQGYNQQGQPFNQTYQQQNQMNQGYAAQQGYPPPQQQGMAMQGYPPPQQYQQQGNSQMVYPQQGFVHGQGIQAFQMPAYSQLPHTAHKCSFPVRIQCPKCNQEVITKTHHEVGQQTVLAACLCFWCIFPLCAIYPLCSKDCQDVEHNCPRCNANVGEKKYEMC